MTQKIQQVDIRDGEYFYFAGKEIKQAIDKRCQSVLRPAYESALNHIAGAVNSGESPDMAALIVALQGSSDDWSAATSEIHRNAEIACEHNLEIQDITRMAAGFSDDVQYVINPQQLKRFGLCS